MSKNYFSKILRVNEVVFPVLVLVTYLFLLIESYTYIGFLSKHILVDSRFFMVLTLISAVLLAKRKLSALCSLVFKINTFFVFPVSVILYLVMQFSESLHFHNYVFSIYHVQPTNFFYIVIFSFALTVINKLIGEPDLKKFMLFLILPIIFIDNLTKVLDSAVSSDVFVVTHLNYSYADKMKESWGMYYDYIEFVKSNTPENSLILVPPQDYPWFLTGNTGFDRYFLYPRSLASGGLNLQTDLKNYDYIMLAWGEEAGSEKAKYGWPKEKIKAEKIIYFDSATHKVIEYLGDYDPVISNKYGGWGIIKLK